MRKNNKSTTITSFQDRIKKHKTKNWNELHEKHKDVLQDTRFSICVDEQDGLCGYTELPIDDIEDSHIDHYRKKSIFPLLTFDWNNFIVSVRDNNFGANYKDNNYCNCEKDYCQILNPIEDSCESYFEYTNTGEIEPKKGIEQSIQEKARKTIEVFNLNHTSLVSRRKSILCILDSYKNQLSNDQIESILSGNGFKSFIEYKLNNP